MKFAKEKERKKELPKKERKGKGFRKELKIASPTWG